MWFYNNEEFLDEAIGGHIGFVYLITNLETGRLYVGKKLFTFKKTKKPLKGKKQKRHSRIPSDWRNYFGSSKELQADVERLGPEKFKREILHLCLTKGTANYLETKEIIDRNALLDSNYYNDWISCKISRSQIKLP